MTKKNAHESGDHLSAAPTEPPTVAETPDALATVRRRILEASVKGTYLQLSAAECKHVHDLLESDDFSKRQERIAVATEELVKTLVALGDLINGIFFTAALGTNDKGEQRTMSFGMVLAAAMNALMQPRQRNIEVPGVYPSAPLQRRR